MDSLISHNFNFELDIGKIVESLKKGNKLIIIKNFPLSDYDLDLFVENIGVSIKEKRNNNGKNIYDVKVTNLNGFFTSIATSNLAFPLHTDCADFDSIPNCIGLLCVEPAEGKQGTSSFMYLLDLLEKLSKNEILKLKNKEWNFKNKKRAILEFTNDTYKICYDRITMESYSNLESAEINELNKLEEIFDSLSFKIKLERGDLVLFRNDFFLHGRDKIDLNSNRLVKRIRFNIGK